MERYRIPTPNPALTWGRPHIFLGTLQKKEGRKEGGERTGKEGRKGGRKEAGRKEGRKEGRRKGGRVSSRKEGREQVIFDHVSSFSTFSSIFIFLILHDCASVFPDFHHVSGFFHLSSLFS